MKKLITAWLDKNNTLAVSIGEYCPKEINCLVELIKKYGVKDEGIRYKFKEAYFSLNGYDFYIVIEDDKSI